MIKYEYLISYSHQTGIANGFGESLIELNCKLNSIENIIKVKDYIRKDSHSTDTKIVILSFKFLRYKIIPPWKKIKE